MLMCEKIIFLIISIIVFAFINNIGCNEYCPAHDFFYPCRCYSSKSTHKHNLIISCVGTEISDIDIKRAFTRLNTYLNGTNSPSRVFHKLEISHTSVKHIYTNKLNLFRNISFKRISIINNSKLQNFDPYIFWSSCKLNTHFVLKEFSKIVNYNRRDPLPILNRFRKLESLTLIETNLDRIAAYSFGRSEQTNLKKIYLNNNEITRVERCAFFKLPKLCVIDLSKNKITSLANYSFAFEFYSRNRLLINLHSNELTTNSFSKYTFHRINRPLFLVISDNLLTYLDEKIFSPLLLQNANNVTLVASFNPFVCDCKFKWILQNRDQLRRSILGNIICDNGRSIWTLSVYDLKSCDD